MRRIAIFIGVALIFADKPSVASPKPRQEGLAPSESATAQTADSVIRVARSQDGLSFRDTNEILVKHASHPDVIRLPDDHLLVVFSYQPPNQSQPQAGSRPALAAVRSGNEGRSWSSPRYLTFEGGRVDPSKVGRPSLASMPNGLVRLYFGLTASQDGSPLVGSAVTRDGVSWYLDPQIRLQREAATAIDPVAFWAGPEVRLLMVPADEAPRRSLRRPPIGIFSSRDGRRFRPTGRMREPFTPSDVVGVRDGYRMYLSDSGGIRCMVSGDGVRWRLTPARCLAGGSDPAVVELQNGGFLMFYCAPLGGRAAGQPEAALASASPSGSPHASGAQADGDGQAGGQTAGEGTPVEGSAGTPRNTSSEEAGWEPFTDADPAAELDAAEPDAAAFAKAPADEMPDDFPPMPDFQNPFDYVSWYSDNSVPAPGENSYESYAQFPIEREGPEWKVMDVLDKGGWKTAEPWDPAAHPDWDAAFQSADDLLARYRDATHDPRPYASPVQYMVDGKLVERPNGPGLLFEISLPSLAGSRYLAKTTLADAWRLENGQINQEKMKDAWTTVLGNAGHLEQGATTIEKLVSVAERSLVEENARSALERGVFRTAEELESAMKTLQEHDLPDPDPGNYLRVECAAMLDGIQYAFSPTGDGSAITSDPDKAQRIADCLGKGQLSDEDFKQAAAIDAKTVNEAVDLLNSHFRESRELMEKGYPALRAADFAKKEEQRAMSNPVVKPIMPCLERARYLQTRAEASRRATQLSYSVHLFKARNGRWPASLDELPAEQRDAVRADPFTNEDLRYRPTDNGFTLYTAGENGADDGGIHSPTGGVVEGGTSDDYVFWPPQKK